MTDSILDSTKKVLGLSSEYDVFDLDIINHINGIFSILNQIGVGPEAGFQIEDDQAIWSDFTNDDTMLNMVKPYMYLRVRLLFDMPGTSYLIAAFQKQVDEMEYRLNVYREGEKWKMPQNSTMY